MSLNEYLLTLRNAPCSHGCGLRRTEQPGVATATPQPIAFLADVSRLPCQTSAPVVEGRTRERRPVESGSWLWSKGRKITMGTFILPTIPHHTFPTAKQEEQLQHKGYVGNVGISRRDGRTDSFFPPTPICQCHSLCLTSSCSLALTVFLSLSLRWLTLLCSLLDSRRIGQ